MFKNLQLILLFVGSLLVTAWVLREVFPYPAEGKRMGGQKRVLFDSGRFDGVFIGSSIVRASFDPEVIDQEIGWECRSFNWGIPATANIQELDIFRTVAREQDLKYAIVLLMEARPPVGKRNSSWDMIGSFGRWENFRVVVNWSESATELFEVLSLGGRHLFSDGLLQQLHAHYVDRPMSTSGYSPIGKLDRYKQRNGQWQKFMSKHPELPSPESVVELDFFEHCEACTLDQPTPFTRAREDHLLEYLDLLAEEGKRLNIKIVLYRPPTILRLFHGACDIRGGRKFCVNSAVSRMEYLTPRILERIKTHGFGLIDLDRPADYPELFDPSLFMDRGHPNEKGAKMISSLVASQLKDLLKDVSCSPDDDAKLEVN